MDILYIIIGFIGGASLTILGGLWFLERATEWAVAKALY